MLDAKENKVGGVTVSKLDYVVNAIGQRTALNQTGTAFASVRGIAWGYDSYGQVTSADSTLAAQDRAYQYDAIGNRKKSANSLTLPVTDNYTANVLNQYSSWSVGVSPTLNPSYDPDGNATAYPLSVAPTVNSTLTYDSENRLTATTVGGLTTTQQFDATGRRISKTTGTNTKLYLYDGWNVIAEYTRGVGVSPTLQKTYLWGTDLSSTPQGAGGVGGLLSESNISNPQSPISYPTYDGNGNISEYLTSSGAVAAHFEYDAFGNTTVNTDTGNQFTYKFSTKPQDVETGLYYYGYRYYDPVTGRWINRDPIEEKGGMNLSGFVGNDGVNKWDLFGLSVWVEYKVVAKSYIDGVGSVGFIRSNAALLPSELIAANIRLQAFAAGASFADAFNQFPSNDSKDGQYRLFGELKIQFCCDGDKIMNKDLIADKEGGVESAQFSISGTVEFIPTINAIGDKVEVEWFLSGRPNELAEVGMQLVQFRTSTQIWQKGKVTFSCRGGSLQKKEDYFKGSRYPTREYWINNTTENRKAKGPLSSLWSESPTMPWFVAE